MIKIKTILRALFYLFISFGYSNLSQAENPTGYEIKVRVSPLANSEFYLGNHYGDKQYVRDTVKSDENGWMTFKGTEKLEGGIYLIVLPNKTYFEIAITDNDQHFTIETDTIDYVGNMKIVNSPENELFIGHQKFLGLKSKESAKYRSALESNKGNLEEEKKLKEQLNDLDKEVKTYRLNILKDHPNSFMAALINAMKEPEVPESPKDKNGIIVDSLFQYKYYKSHYFDHLNFSDARLLRTPIFQTKLNTYLNNLTAQIPDSIIISVDTIILKAEVNQDVFKYCVATLANTYETSKIMGFDKIFVHIAEKYYLSNKAFWADSALKAKITERVNKIKPTILFGPAHDLTMPDTSLKLQKLYNLNSKYTALVFWDPTCSHCKTEIPKLSSFRDSAQKAGLSFEVFAVGIESDIDLWKKFIAEKKLKWINVSDLYNNTKFRDYYDIYSTPVIYLLDARKRIIAKRLDTDKLSGFIRDIESGKFKLPLN
ncbi:MAG: hypothetical protein RL065_1477 [Bacteroidota bacterium]|jgi:thiol-disulfide isomerase/thioredoxin